MPFTETRPNNRPPEQAFRPIQLRRPTPRQETFSHKDPAEEEDKGIYCRACSFHLTDQDQAVAIDGRHQHAFFNPSGMTFEIRCFQAAPGVVPFAEPSDAFSWFPGFSWQIVLCASCRTHLGWQFIPQGAGRGFFGLIAPRLRTRD